MAVDLTSIEQPDRRRLTTGLVLVVSLTAFEALAVATILPVAIGDIGGVRFYGWAFSSFMLANLVGIQMAGEAADRRGVGRPFVLGCVFFATGLAVAGLSRDSLTFIFGRVLQGAGAGALSAAAYVAVTRGYASATRPRMLAILSTAWVIPGMVGPAAASGLAHLFGWRSVFLALIPLVVIALLLAAPALRELKGAAAGHLRRSATVPAVMLTVGVGLALLGVETSPVPLAAVIVTAGVALAVYALQRLLPVGTLYAAPGMPAAIAAQALMSAAFFGAEVYVPLALTTVRAQSTVMAGVALTAATLCWTAGTWIQSRVVARWGHRALTVLGLVLMVAGISGTATVLMPSVAVIVAPAMWGIAGLGMGIAYPTATLVALGSAPAGREGEASASMQLANVLGMAIGTGVGGGLFSFVTAMGFSMTAAVATVDVSAIMAAAVGIAAALRLPRHSDASARLPPTEAPDTVASS